ncbi:hypothetical protein FQR65_LT10926 [Abscondita terminalis]|nr:hypothetical protein FQR65_LT10926 [Abscondita terminalis]
MGGHGEQHLKVPDYRIYKVENVPELVKLQKMLAAQGLSDPWARNEVWRYDPKQWGTQRGRMLLTVSRAERLLSGSDSHHHDHH